MSKKSFAEQFFGSEPSTPELPDIESSGEFYSPTNYEIPQSSDVSMNTEELLERKEELKSDIKKEEDKEERKELQEELREVVEKLEEKQEDMSSSQPSSEESSLPSEGTSTFFENLLGVSPKMLTYTSNPETSEPPRKQRKSPTQPSKKSKSRSPRKAKKTKSPRESQLKRLNL